jgi:phage major head subunit gpT-like protein
LSKKRWKTHNNFRSIRNDGDKPVIIRHTYIIGADVFVTKKAVLFAGEQVWLNRNELSFNKICRKKKVTLFFL